MNQMGNAFVACGVIYAIDQFNTESTTINLAYDTKTSKYFNPNIQITNEYNYTTTPWSPTIPERKFCTLGTTGDKLPTPLHLNNSGPASKALLQNQTAILIP